MMVWDDDRNAAYDGANWKGSMQWFGWDSCVTNSRGGGQAHQNMPPYSTLYMWKRTA